MAGTKKTPKKKGKTPEVEILDDDMDINLNLYDDVEDDDEVFAIAKWSKENAKTIGNTKVNKGTLFGKKMVHWDVVPRCDASIMYKYDIKVEELEDKLKNVPKTYPLQKTRLEYELNKTLKERAKFSDISELCDLDEKGRCPYKAEKRIIREPKCVIIDRMMRAHRQEVFRTYMDLDQDSYNKIGLELLPLYVLQCRLNILISSQPLMHSSGTGGGKASPLLKELRRVQQSIQEIRTKLDTKKEKLRPAAVGDGGNKPNPLRGDS